MNNNKLKTILIVLVFSFNCYGQSLLTLNRALEIALGESYLSRSSKLALTSTEKNLEATQLGLRTSLDFEFDLPRYSRSLSNQFDISTGTEKFYEIGSTVMESRFSINQPIIYTNGTFSLIGSIFGRDQFTGSSGTTRDFYSNLIFRLRQPLFTFNNLSANLERAEINLEKAKRNFNRAQAEIIYSVTQSYLDLFQLKKSLEITNEKVTQTEIAYHTAQNKFKAGLIAEVEALQLEVDLIASKNEYLNNQRRFEEAKNNFKQLIGLSLKEDIDIDIELTFTPVEIDLESAINFALTNRSEVYNSKSEISLSELSLDEVNSKGRFRADLSLNYGINKNDENFKYIFNEFAENQSVAFTLSIPVWNWGKNNKESEAAQANLDMAKISYDYQKQQIEKEIISAVNRIKSATARLNVLKKSVEVAQKTYDINLERFSNGNITSFEFSQMQLKLTDSKLTSLNALIEFRLALADIQRKTLHNFEK